MMGIVSDPGSAWLLIRFSPFPAGNPVADLGIEVTLGMRIDCSPFRDYSDFIPRKLEEALKFLTHFFSSNSKTLIRETERLDHAMAM